MSTEMLTYDETARYLGLRKGTLYWMVSKERMPHVRLGPRLVRFWYWYDALPNAKPEKRDQLLAACEQVLREHELVTEVFGVP